MSELPSILTTAEVAEILGVTRQTVHKYVSESRPIDGCRYRDNPFPPPDDYAGRSPWWSAGRVNEIITWDLRRRGHGWRGLKPLTAVHS